ncbi:MAG: hypothetical protein KJ722_01620 [Candidatus Omnitrophica bacterium]|nr:hypothetical protein [Candidatus Omnitrophota bacterium]
MKLSLLFLSLLIPVVLFIGILSLSRNILEKTSFYPKSLTINTIWLAKEIKEISTDKSGNKVYELILKSGQKVNLQRDKDEGLFSFETEESADGSFFVRTNRVAEDKEVKKIINKINKRFADLYFRKEMESGLYAPEGYKQDIGVEYSGMSYVLYVFLTIFCLSMYLPIVKAIIKLLRKGES